MQANANVKPTVHTTKGISLTLDKIRLAPFHLHFNEVHCMNYWQRSLSVEHRVISYRCNRHYILYIAAGFGWESDTPT
jgi:hypothetical protein